MIVTLKFRENDWLAGVVRTPRLFHGLCISFWTAKIDEGSDWSSKECWKSVSAEKIYAEVSTIVSLVNWID